MSLLPQLLPDLLHHDNARRVAAEGLFTQHCAQSPDQVLLELVACISQSDGHLGTLAAALLRQAVGKTRATVFYQCRSETQTQVKAELLRLLSQHLCPAIGRLLATCVADLGGLQCEGEWPDLLRSLLQQLSAVSSKQNLLAVVAQLIPYLSESYLQPHLQPLHSMLQAHLGGQAAPELQSSAAEVLAALAQTLQSPHLLQPFSPCVTAVMQVCA